MFIATISFSQIKWDFYSVRTDSLYHEIHMTATIDAPWYIFSQYRTIDQIPLSTTVSFVKSDNVKILSNVYEHGEIIKPKDTSEGVYYKDKVTFIKAVKIKDTKTPIAIKGTINYQLCNGDQCMVPTRKEFSIIIEPNK